MPGPLYEWTEVLFALSYEALNMKGALFLRKMSFNVSANRKQLSSLSIMQGPAIKNNSDSPIEKLFNGILFDSFGSLGTSCASVV